jgi:hypothetical protein
MLAACEVKKFDGRRALAAAQEVAAIVLTSMPGASNLTKSRAIACWNGRFYAMTHAFGPFAS